MIHHQPFPFKNLGLWSLLILCGLLSAYLLFIAIVCIWVGFHHLLQNGFWMPILAGCLIMIGILWLFLRLSRFILNGMKEKEIINL